ncbi:MAG: endolytic transglycosylase MltG [Candidatus Doudnabacteria bacterium]
MNEYEIPRSSKSIRNKVQLAAAVVLVALLVAVIYYETKVNQAASSESRQVMFTVAKGSRTRQVAEELAKEKIIGSPTVFLIYTSLHSAAKKIQAGQYSLNANMAIPEIVNVLTQGKVIPTSSKVTFIEGETNAQVAKDLGDQNIAGADDFLHATADSGYSFKYLSVAAKVNYQGFLFPDTYEIGKTDTVKDIVQKMLTDFQTKFTDKMYADSQARDVKLIDLITLASIVEKEVGRNKTNLTADDLSTMQKERELVASVFYNRLSAGMPLESDATVNYITGKSDRSVTTADTKIKSAYNTYQVKGLPPTPISNPGLDSIMAAIYPAKSDYLYFLNAPDGTAYFAKTLDEHNANKAKYLK